MTEKDREIILSEDDKKDLIVEFNKRGYLLEDRMIEVLESIENNYGIQKGQIGIEYAKRNNNDRVEIDALLFTNQKLFVFDAKRTEYNWIFAQSLNKLQSPVNLICSHPKRGLICLPMNLEEERSIRMVHHDFAIAFEGEKLERKNDKQKLNLPTERFRPIHDAIRQILKESKAILLEGKKYLKSECMFLIPIIVTNARLLYIDYKRDHIDDKGDLTDYKSMIEVPAIGYNFHEYLGFNTEQGLSSSKPENIVKTVIIVNINNLRNIIKYLSERYLYIDFATDKKFLTIPRGNNHDANLFWQSD